jgi:hypothetical protein
MLAALSGKVPRVIALIDLPELRWQVERIGGVLENDLTSVLGLLETGAAKLAAMPEERLAFGAVYVYSPGEADRLREVEGHTAVGRVIFKPRRTGVNRACWGCYKACTHCGRAAREGWQGGDNPIADDLLDLGREDQYDWAVVVTTNLRLIPVVSYLQSHGRKIIHGCFSPVAMDLTQECWASIDLRPLYGGSA